jgi:hypothetical protein
VQDLFDVPPGSPWKWGGYRPTPQFNTERELANHVLSEFYEDFTIDREVPGWHCTGKRLRLDAVVIPKDTYGWLDGNETALGIEFKLPGSLNGIKDYGKWFAQCVDYTHSIWSSYGRIPIFACPFLPFGDHIFKRVLGQLGIGELINLPRYGWSFVRNESHRQWSQANGVEEAKRTRLRPAAGSR